MWFPIIARLPFAIAGLIASWFYVTGTPRYDIVQLGIFLIIIAVFMICIFYAPTILGWFGIRRKRRD